MTSNGRKMLTGDKTTDMARIVRGVFDATDRLSRSADTRTAVEAQRQLETLRAMVKSLRDPAFAAAFDAALVQLLPADRDRNKS